jgi:glycosyltransferase involved in cell wall biosynthesis
VRIAIVYDCLFPYTVGGAERWLRLLAEDLAPDHEVTYVTRRQWPEGEEPDLPGVECVTVSPGGPLYMPAGRRRIGPPLRFGAGVLRHFLGRRGAYDVVHCVSFPYFSLLAVRLALAGARGPRVVCEWLEYWTADYWRDYLGPVGGWVGRAVQRLCLALSPVALVFSRLNAERLRAAGYGGEVQLLPGLYSGSASPPAEPSSPPRVLFVGRHIPEKRPAVLPDVIDSARRMRPDLVATVVGDGPERGRVQARVDELRLGEVVQVPGRLDSDELEEALRTAACLLVPSIREGHGMVIAEAAAAGVPCVVCRHPDNAAVELVEEGVNGSVAADPSPEALAEALLRVLDGGQELRQSTAAWFERNADNLSADASIRRLRELYAGR